MIDTYVHYQHRLPMQAALEEQSNVKPLDIESTLQHLLEQDLTFKNAKTSYATHSMHAFAAKFPPQLPELFIRELTTQHEVVLDPMAGSGTTLVEAVLAGRQGIGVDLDPLAVLLNRVKTTPLEIRDVLQAGNEVLQRAEQHLPLITGVDLDQQLGEVYEDAVIAFFRYWFAEPTIAELYGLAQAIREVASGSIRDFLQVIFSSIIITKSGGVTLARDLAHSRPHRQLDKTNKQHPFAIFAERLRVGAEALEHINDAAGHATMYCGDARALPLDSNSVHLIVTSPPYAANAIDYMRAHKFSLMWFGYVPKELSTLRRRYIGSELQALDGTFDSDTAQRVLQTLAERDPRRAGVVAHYYRDMEAVLREMLRVLAPERAAVLVVGTSTIRGVGIEVPSVLAELAAGVGFHVVGVATREIVRNARLLPVSHNSERGGIEARMHEEGVIALIKPALETVS